MSEQKKNENEFDLETTNEIKQGHAPVGKLNLVVEIGLTIICIIYLILNFRP